MRRVSPFAIATHAAGIVTGMFKLRARLFIVPVGIIPSVLCVPTNPLATAWIVPSPPAAMTNSVCSVAAREANPWPVSSGVV